MALPDRSGNLPSRTATRWSLTSRSPCASFRTAWERDPAGRRGAAVGRLRVAMGEERVTEDREAPWQQRLLDNLWFLIALSVVIPGLLYLAWGLWELAELPTWGGG